MIPHPSGISIGKTQKLKNPVKHYSWTDKRTPEEIAEDIENRKHRRDQIELEEVLSSPEVYSERKIPKVRKEQLQEV